MIIERPARPDSAVDALGRAVRVLTRPSFLWAPVLLGVLFALPTLAIPDRYGQQPVLTDAEFQQLLGDLGWVFLISLVVGVALGPIFYAALLRLSRQFLDGQPADPFGPGTRQLAWRIFLQSIAYLLLVLGALVPFAAIIAVGIFASALIISVVAVVVGAGLCFVILLRLAIATPLLATGLGPIAAIDRSWALTRGRIGLVFRWLAVPTAVLGVASAVISALLGAISGVSASSAIVTIVSAAAVAPLNVVLFIVLVQLTRLLLDLDAHGVGDAGIPSTPGPAPSTPPYATQVSDR